MTEVVSADVYTEELSLDRQEPAVYLAAAQRAVWRLGWTIMEVYENRMVFQTRSNEYFEGDIASITVERKKAVLRIQPANAYYRDELQTGRNVARLKRALEHAVRELDKTKRIAEPVRREKYGALVPSGSYTITPMVVYVNAMVFVVMVIAGISPLHPTAKSLFLWGGNYGPAVAAGEWWRLLSYMFLHGGGLHLLGNTFAMLYIGMFLEPLMGRFRFASAYVLTGICAGLMSIMMHGETVSVGASGAIFGLYGVFLSVLTTSHIQKTMRKTMLRSILFFVVFNLMMGLQGNTDNAAHIGGLLSGLVIGYVYYPGMARRYPIGRQVLTTGVLALFVVALGIYFLRM